MENNEQLKAPAPTLEQLEAEAAALFSQSGSLQYEIEIKKAQLTQINLRLLTVNTEAGKLKAAPQAQPELKLAEKEPA